MNMPTKYEISSLNYPKDIERFPKSLFVVKICIAHARYHVIHKFQPIEKMFFEIKREDLTPWGKPTPKEHTHHQNTFLGALSGNLRFSG